jgi:hypothetical protein
MVEWSSEDAPPGLVLYDGKLALLSSPQGASVTGEVPTEDRNAVESNPEWIPRKYPKVGLNSALKSAPSFRLSSLEPKKKIRRVL